MCHWDLKNLVTYLLLLFQWIKPCFEFVEIDEQELYLCLILITCPLFSLSIPYSPLDRSGIENVNSVEALQETLIRALRTLIMKNHPNEASIFTKLLLKLPDLRSLNNMHSEELLAFKVHP